MTKRFPPVYFFLLQPRLGGEQAWTPNFYIKSFDIDSVQVGKAVFGKEIYTILGIEPRTYSNPGRSGNPYSVCWFFLLQKPNQHSHVDNDDSFSFGFPTAFSEPSNRAIL